MKIEVHTLLCGLSLHVMSEPEHRLLSLLVWVVLYLPSPIPGPFSAFSVSRETEVGQISIDCITLASKTGKLILEGI